MRWADAGWPIAEAFVQACTSLYSRIVRAAGRPSPLVVFLSHTSAPADQPFVSAAMEAVASAGAALSDMSHFTPSGAPPAEVCEKKVADADAYVGIVGMHYGSRVPDRPEQSFVELEFEAARRYGLDILVYVIHGQALNTHGNQQSPDAAAAQQRFRGRLLRGGPTCFLTGSSHDVNSNLRAALVERWARRSRRRLLRLLSAPLLVLVILVGIGAIALHHVAAPPPQGTSSCNVLVDAAIQAVVPGPHTSRVRWTTGPATCFGFKHLPGFGGHPVLQISAGGECLNDANRAIFYDSCPANGQLSEDWIVLPSSVGRPFAVLKNEATNLNLTADQPPQPHELSAANGPSNAYNVWSMKIPAPH